MSIIQSTLWDCYTYIIGLYKGTCQCWDPKTGFELDYNTSLSGLYLNKLAPLNTIQGLENCQNSDLWYMMDEARSQAIINFVTDLNRAISSKYKILYRTYSGVIGRQRNDKDRSISKTLAGVVLRCNPIKGGKLTLSGIGTIFNFTGALTVTVSDNLGVTHGTYNLNCVTDTYTQNLITELELPLYSPYVDYLEYYITYTLGVNQPRDNDLACFCGHFKPVYNINFPYYTKRKDPVYGWANYVMAGGIETDTLEELYEDCSCESASKYMNGLVLNVYFNCDFGETYCEDELDFRGDPLAGAIAHAIWYRAGFLMADMILMSGEINRQTMMNRENLLEYQKEWVLRYTDMIAYIADNIDVSKSGCFGCRDRVEVHRRGMLI